MESSPLGSVSFPTPDRHVTSAGAVRHPGDGRRDRAFDDALHREADDREAGDRDDGPDAAADDGLDAEDPITRRLRALQRRTAGSTRDADGRDHIDLLA